ncbi:DUF1097 domain-containing protein [Lentisphaerota bacterium WC36G]|nr:DUF1097 domain-containing protein [Lentisphaerae bacterium WC36]
MDTFKNSLKFLPHCIIIGILASTSQILDQVTINVAKPVIENGETIKAAVTFDPIIAWALFLGWALYFLAGCTVKEGAKALAGWGAGELIAIGIIIAGNHLSGCEGFKFFGFPIAVGILSFTVILFEKVKGLNFIPAWFIGAAATFAYTGNPASTQTGLWWLALTVFLSGFAGLFYGWLTVVLRTAYGKMVGEGAEETEAAAE